MTREDVTEAGGIGVEEFSTRRKQMRYNTKREWFVFLGFLLVIFIVGTAHSTEP